MTNVWTLYALIDKNMKSVETLSNVQFEILKFDPSQVLLKVSKTIQFFDIL